MSGLGQFALMDGDYEQARLYFQEGARISKELGSRIDYLWATTRLGHAELLAGNISRARQIFGEVLHGFQEDGSQIGVVFALERILILHTTIGKVDIAAQLIGWTDATREKIKDTRPKLEQAEMDKMIAACRTAMGEAAYINAYEEGTKLTFNEAVHLALQE